MLKCTHKLIIINNEKPDPKHNGKIKTHGEMKEMVKTEGKRRGNKFILKYT